MKLGDLARQLGCELEGDPTIDVTGPAPIGEAGPGQVTFVANPRYQSKLKGLRAAAVILAPGMDAPGVAVLRSTEPYAAFVRLLTLFHEPYRPPPGIDDTVRIAPSAAIGPRASIGAYAVVGENVTIGADARIDPNVVIYPGVTIGDRFTAHAGAVVRERSTIGHDVTLQSGVVVGGDGFGYLPDEKGAVHAIPQTGGVVLEDGVEIGANTTIDRATVGVTRIRRAAKIDNLVQIGHGCEVGERALLAAQVGLAGHLTIGAGARIAAQSGVPNDIEPGAVYAGYPAVEIRTWRRTVAALLHLPELLRRVRRIERRLGIRADEEY